MLTHPQREAVIRDVLAWRQRYPGNSAPNQVQGWTSPWIRPYQTPAIQGLLEMLEVETWVAWFNVLEMGDHIRRHDHAEAGSYTQVYCLEAARQGGNLIVSGDDIMLKVDHYVRFDAEAVHWVTPVKLGRRITFAWTE